MATFHERQRKAAAKDYSKSSYAKYRKEHPGGKCNAVTRSGGRCVLSHGHSFGHRKSL